MEQQTKVSWSFRRLWLPGTPCAKNWSLPLPKEMPKVPNCFATRLAQRILEKSELSQAKDRVDMIFSKTNEAAFEAALRQERIFWLPRTPQAVTWASDDGATAPQGDTIKLDWFLCSKVLSPAYGLEQVIATNLIR
eukprot:807102-Amphidinium_carterae.1